MVSAQAVTIVVGLTAAYLLLLTLLARRESDRYQVVGPLLMLKTQAGKRMLDRVSKWRGVGVVADVFILLTVAAGAVMLIMVVWQNVLLFTHTEAVAQRPPRLEEALAIPGVNPIIPLWYGLVALVVALVIHEGGHGVLARHARMRVKSLGLLFFVIPVGAFVEPDEVELQRSSLREKLRLFSAGPGPNIVVAFLCVALFTSVFVPALAPARTDGVAVLSVSDELPADAAGLQPGMFIIRMEGQAVTDRERFTSILENSTSNESISVRFSHRGEVGEVNIVPLDKYQYYQGLVEQGSIPREVLNETWRGVPFLGVGVRSASSLQALEDSLADPIETEGFLEGSLFYVALPFAGLQPFPQWFQDLYTVGGGFADWGQGYWITANMLFWLFWINIVLGTFNALPFWVLDGGHMFRQSLHAWLRGRRDIPETALRVEESEERGPHFVSDDPVVQERLERVDERAAALSRVVTTVLLVLLLVPLFVPGLLARFGAA